MNADALSNVSPVALTVAVVLMLLVESLAPLAPLLPSKARVRHGARNIAIALCASVFAIGGNLVFIAISSWAATHHFGLLNLLDPPWILRFLVALISIDFLEYWRHRTHHAVAPLWRLHRVHHTDPAVDATTSVRGHPLESVVAYAWFSLWVLLLGLDPLSLALRTLIAAMALAWHHAGIRLPERVDALISLITPTPRTHRVHHHRDVQFTDTNFGTLFTWWDRMFGTFTPGTKVDIDAKTGLDGFDDEQSQSVWGVLKSPLVKG